MKRCSLILIALLITACSSNNIADHTTIIGRMDNISITDLRSAIGPNQLLVAQATFHNDGNNPQNGYYRCQFFDVNKMQVGDPQPWQLITIYPGEDQTVKCLASQLEATNFKVEFSADGKNVSVYDYKK